MLAEAPVLAQLFIGGNFHFPFGLMPQAGPLYLHLAVRQLYATTAGVDDLELHLLYTQVPLVKPPKQHTEIPVDPKTFDAYTGQYQMAPNVILSVTRGGSHLFVQLPGQPKFEIFAEGERDYFLKAVDAQGTFESDSNGRATAVVMHQMGRDLRGSRVPQ